MLNTRSTFLYFLKNNLPGVVVHPIRVDPNNPQLGDIQLNAVNVEFLNTNFGSALKAPQQQTSIKLAYDDEITAVNVAQQVADLLQAASVTPLLDYTDPANPVPVGNKNVSWDYKQINFRPIVTEGNYCRFDCLLNLKFSI